MDIEVVLTGIDPKLGKRGEIVKVSSGYANNCLIPQKKAVLATPQAKKAFEAEKAREAREAEDRLTAARQAAHRLQGLGDVVVEVMAGEGDRLYGAVTAQNIQEALAARGVKIEKHDVRLEEPIKKLGEYKVPLKLHAEVVANVRVVVAAKK